MSYARLDSVQHISVDSAVIARTMQVLQAFGGEGFEGLVLWLGEVGETEARVTHAAVPEQRPVKGEDGLGYFVDSSALFELNIRLAETGLRLIAQVHSHPSEAYHSDTDDRYAIVTADGGLSLVVPNFGRAGAHPADWAVYRLNKGYWKELDEKEIRSLLSVR